MTEERLIEIETRIAYQEDLLQELNEVVCRQRDQIDQLEATCRFLVERLRGMEEAAGGVQEDVDEKPPHY